MEWLIVWLVGAIVVGVVAKTRNRVGFAWFLLAMVISPLLAGVLVLALGHDTDGTQPPATAAQRNCPECKELVRADARLCKHCHSKLQPIM